MSNTLSCSSSCCECRVFIQYSMLHICPPMSTPSALWNSPLVDGSNFVSVDKHTLQHIKYKNVFALGDCSSAPTSKTAAACSMLLFPYLRGHLVLRTTRDLRIVFFSFESNLESNRPSDSFSNRIFESNRPYTTQAVTQPNGLQAYRTTC